MCLKPWQLVIAFVVASLAFGSDAFGAGVAEQVHPLIVRQDFDAAYRLAKAELESSAAASPAAMSRRLEALQLLIEIAMADRATPQPAYREWVDQAYDLALKRYGENDPRIARYLAQKGLQRAHDNPREGLELIDKSLALLDAAPEEHRADWIAVVVYKDRALFQALEYGKNMDALQRARAIAKDLPGIWNKFQYARVLNELSLKEVLNGNRAGALKDAAESAALFKKLCGADSLSYADALGTLSQVQLRAGDLLGARKNLEDFVALLRKQGVGGVWLDQADNTLAYIYRHLGYNDLAQGMFEEIIARNEPGADGKFNAILPETLDTYGGLELDRGNLEHARRLYERALELEGKLTAEKLAPVFEKPLLTLGTVAIEQDDLQAAEGFLRRAAEIDRNDSSGYLRNDLDSELATLALAQGQPGDAERLLAQNIESMASRSGERNSRLLNEKCNLALAKARLGKRAEAFSVAEDGEQLRIDFLRQTGPALEETQAINLKANFNSCAAVLLPLAAASPDPSLANRSWTLVSSSRAFATHLLAARIAAARRKASDPAVKEHWKQWEVAARAYATLLISPTNAADAAKARDAFERAENALGEPTLSNARLPSASFDQLLGAAGEHHVVVAYSVVNHLGIGRNDREVFRAKGAQDLYAMVYENGASRIVALGDSREAERKIGNWVGLLRDPKSDAKDLDTLGNAVKAAIWEPLHIQTSPGLVMVVPDGPVHRMSFAALPAGDGEYLVERGWKFHLLDSENDLRSEQGARDAPARLLAIGAPDFGPAAAAPAASGSCNSPLTPLPGSALEAQGVARLSREVEGTDPKVLIGAQATKAALERWAQDYNVIHIATHTLETTPGCSLALGSRGINLPSAGTTPAPGPALQDAVLAFAGANRFYAEGATDGVLSAAETSTLHLENAQWIVLSACDSGLGDIVSGEGVFGLRRGFRLAGARTVVMSLWSVSDSATTEWMLALYDARWRQHASTPDAVAQAQLSTMSARRRRGESTHPFFWAAFVASGYRD